MTNLEADFVESVDEAEEDQVRLVDGEREDGDVGQLGRLVLLPLLEVARLRKHQQPLQVRHTPFLLPPANHDNRGH